MNKACIVLAHGAGLFSNINKVITCMEMYEKVHVDWSNGDNIYRVTTDRDPNAWNHLFQPTSIPSEAHDVVIKYPHQRYTWKHAGELYRSNGDWRNRLHSLWRKLPVLGPILDRAMVFSGFTIGVLVRSNAIAGEQESGLNAGLDDYVRAIHSVKTENHARNPQVFAVCSDEESSRRMSKEFNARIYHFTRRAENRSIDQHMQFPQTIMDAKHCLSEVISLSRCDVLVHQVSNMATAALYMNPFMESVYLKP